MSAETEDPARQLPKPLATPLLEERVALTMARIMVELSQREDLSEPMLRLSNLMRGEVVAAVMSQPPTSAGKDLHTNLLPLNLMFGSRSITPTTPKPLNWSIEIAARAGMAHAAAGQNDRELAGGHLYAIGALAAAGYARSVVGELGA